jgi:hypothetical protein
MPRAHCPEKHFPGLAQYRTCGTDFININVAKGILVPVTLFPVIEFLMFK